MADVRPWKIFAAGGGLGELRECADGDGEYWVVAPYCTVGGTANALTLTLQHGLGKPSGYRAGQQFRFRAGLSNTGAATINVAGLGAKTAVTVTGAALPAGYIRTDVDTTITYDAVSDRFVVGRDLQRGSNPNGEYVQSADGTQICTLRRSVNLAIDTAFVGGFRSNYEAWTYPASFAGGTTTSLQGSAPVTAHGLMFQGDGSSGVNIAVLAPTSVVAGTRIISATVIGRWY